MGAYFAEKNHHASTKGRRTDQETKGAGNDIFHSKVSILVQERIPSARWRLSQTFADSDAIQSLKYGNAAFATTKAR
jgi:hypothetical protein